MLKKAGIVVAAATAGLLALSPLALAEEEIENSVEVEQSNDCDFSQVETATGSASPTLPVVLPTLGDQTQEGNCTNGVDTETTSTIGDVIEEVVPPLPVVP